MHADEWLDILPKEERNRQKTVKTILWGQGVKHRYMSFPFTFSQDSALCFSGSSELIALKFTAFKARAQLIIWLPESITAAQRTGLSADPQTALYTVRSKHKKKRDSYCTVVL